MRYLITILMLIGLNSYAHDCCAPPKAKPVVKKRVVQKKTVVQKSSPVVDKDEMEQEQDQKQDQKQNVNIHIHNSDRHSNDSSSSSYYNHQPRFMLGVHLGCGPVGIKASQLTSSVTEYKLKSGLIVGGSVSVRVLGPVWLTGQVFSNDMYTAGIQLGF